MKRRLCPVCQQAYLDQREVAARVPGPGDREVITGRQVRVLCARCGFGEVYPIHGGSEV